MCVSFLSKPIYLTVVKGWPVFIYLILNPVGLTAFCCFFLIQEC